MVSTHSPYTRGISPPKYRRQTLEIFDIYDSNSHKDLTHLPPRPVSALDRKWVHRSLGDLTSDRELINSHPRLQTDFYQELLQKYPQAFMRRRNAREAGRKLFNSRLHVRFKDEQKPLEQRTRSDMNLHKNNHQLTNWDREVGPYMSKNSRECFTSAEQSECSGSVLSLKQRLHINSVTLNKLLNEKSPLRKKFERDRATDRDDSGTENEQTLEEYFLDKSRQRSQNRIKHRRVLQRRITSNINNKEQEKTTAHRRWISKSASPTRRNMYSLPIRHDKSNSGHSHENIDSVIKDTDLKIDTLLEKINCKLSGPESPPDSAIDIDTLSVQSFVSSDKVMNSDNVYQVSIDLSANDKEGDFDSQSSPESSPSVCNNKSGTTSSESAMVGKSAISTKAVISQVCQTSVCNNKHDTDVQHIENKNSIDNKTASLGGPGLLQLYMNQLEPKTSDIELQTVNDSYTDQSNIGKVVTKAEASDKVFVNDPELLGSERECSNKPDAVFNNASPTDHQEMIAALGAEMNISTSTLPPRGRQKKREVTSTSAQPNDRIVPNRSDVDTSILDEIQFAEMSYDLDGRHSSLDNVDDTDVRLGIPKLSVHDARIAEKYHRTRSPSPFIVKNRKASPRNRPSSAPLLRTEVMEMKIIDIPLTVSSENCESIDASNTHVKHNTISENDSCQQNGIQRKTVYDIIPNGQSKLDAKKKSCVQTADSKILVSSSQIKQRNNPNVVETVDAEIHHSYTENGISPKDIAEAMNNELTGENSDKILAVDHDILEKELLENKVSKSSVIKDLDPTDNEKQDHKFIAEQKGFYKPSAASPRMNEKRVRLRNLLKSKKDTAQEDHMAKVIVVGKPVQNYSAHEDDKLQHHSHKHSEVNIDGSSSETLSLMSLDDTEKTLLQNCDRSLREMKNDPNETLKDANAGIHVAENVVIERLHDSDTESDVQTVKSKSDIKNGSPVDTSSISTSGESLPQSANVPPVKPARTKHKKLLPNLNLSQDRIIPNGHETVTVVYSDSSKSRITRDMKHSSSNSKDQDAKSSNPDNMKNLDDRIEVMPDPYPSNLERSKDISASKTSLFGSFKSATKGKLKSLKKAMSLDKGIDKAGAVSFPDPNKENSRGDKNVEPQKMKKAPSLKSIASLFGRKKKKGKLTFADTQSSSTPGSCHSLSSDLPSSTGNQQPGPISGSRPVGKLQAVNLDGTQLIQLTKPKNGPIGFFIAKGSARYKNGIFISRFADSEPEKVFGGLLSVGDEILEVNGRFLRDLSQDDVYNIISASPIIVMKIFPFIARKDV